jgi:uncharacterized protein
MHDAMTLDCSRIAQDLQIRKVQVESVVQLLDEGNTVPFVTRYRKERTGGLNEEVIRQVQARVQALRQLADRKQTILKSIENQGKLTDELRQAIFTAETPKRLEDLYLPYKPKKRSLANVARERGLEPLALAVWSRDPTVANLAELLPTMVNPEKELKTPEDVLQGVQHILAEQIAETADVRAAVRSIVWETGKLTTTKSENLPDGQGLDYKDYFQFTEPVRQIPPHRILAINRGEKEGALKARLEWNAEAVERALFAGYHGRPPLLSLAEHPHADFLRVVANDALARLLIPSLEREVRRELTEEAERHAVEVFARNLRSLLLQRPLRGRRVLAIDPGFRTGCKLAALDDFGNLLEDAVIFPHAPQNKKREARWKLEELVRKHGLSLIAVGNGTACRETEEVVAELITELEQRRTGAGTPALPPPPELPPAPAPAPAVEPAVTPMLVAAAAPPAEAHIAVGADVPALETPLELVLAAPALPAGQGDIAPVVVAAPGAQQPGITAAAAVPAAPAGAPASASAPRPQAPPAPPLPDLSALPEAPPDLAYVIVNEAGASIYSASAVGREEFPNYDATLRGTVSIGRRLQDPLSELVKIDPQNIGVGLYQHDVHPRYLKESLDAVVESCVNHVGVDLNTASVPLLRYVAGMNQLVAREVVEYRKQHGPFRSREQLLQVPGVGQARFVQAAGFLRIAAGDNPLDQTSVHPESYPVAQRLLAEVGTELEALTDQARTEELRTKLKALAPEEVSARLEAGVPTVRDIIEALGRPGRDPREDLPPPIFKKGVLKLEDLQHGMELKGTVLNVVDFGAFVDIGLKDSGLVHISQMANRFIKSPYEVVAVGDVVTVWVLTVDQARRRVSLTMIRPGTERKPPERKPASDQAPAGRPKRGGRPRGRRPAPAPGQAAAPGTAQPPPPPQGSALPTARPQHAKAPPQQPAARQGPPPRRPRRAPPKPKLSQAALQGAAPLRTFSELAAYLEAKQTPPPPAAEPAPEQAEKSSAVTPQ